MMSDRTKAVLELVTFMAAAAIVVAAGALIWFLWGILQSIALLGGTAAALVVGAS